MPGSPVRMRYPDPLSDRGASGNPKPAAFCGMPARPLHLLSPLRPGRARRRTFKPAACCGMLGRSLHPSQLSVPGRPLTSLSHPLFRPPCPPWPLCQTLVPSVSFFEEGKTEGARRMARLALEGRFGPLAEDMLAALRSADEITLTAVASHLTSDALQQVQARLGLVYRHFAVSARGRPMRRWQRAPGDGRGISRPPPRNRRTCGRERTAIGR
jgi:hypothetical protein